MQLPVSSPFELSVLIALGVSTVWQLFYWAFFMLRVRRRRPAPEPDKYPDLSIVVCARNEEDNLTRLVEALVAQEYPAKKQIVLVDDCSTDDTPMVMARLREKYPEVYTTTLPVDPKFKHGKKLALTVGIRAAQYETMLFTDADCVPATNDWLRTVARAYKPGTEMVLGYGRYKREGGLLNLLIRFETFWNAVQYMGFARALRPFMGVGRNLSYTRQLFERSSKFRNNINVLSGDDDMMVSEMGRRSNTQILYEFAGQTESEAKRTWRTYSAQKSRHLTTANLYPWSVKFFLVSELLTRFVWWLSLAVCLVLWHVSQWPFWLWVSVGCAASRVVLMHVALGVSAAAMKEGAKWLLALPLDLLIPMMQFLAWLTGVATRSRNTWK